MSKKYLFWTYPVSYLIWDICLGQYDLPKYGKRDLHDTEKMCTLNETIWKMDQHPTNFHRTTTDASAEHDQICNVQIRIQCVMKTISGTYIKVI